MLRRLVVCFSFAMCCFLNTWVELGQQGGSFYERYHPLGAVVVPVIAWEIGIALGMFGIWEFIRRRPPKPRRLLNIAFLMLSCVPMGIAAVAGLRLLPVDVSKAVGNPLFWPVALILAAAPVVLAIRRPEGASRFVRSVFLYVSPVLALIVFQASRVTLLRYPNSAYADGPLAAVTSGTPRIRVVWVIFDELSQAIAFQNRPPDLQLPNLDDLKAHSFHANAAHAPANFTAISMPSLIIGQHVISVRPQGPADLLLMTQPDSPAIPWSSAPNVFDDARKLGFNTALAGWYFPYGRLLNHSLTKCYWMAQWLAPGEAEPFEPKALAAAMWKRARLQYIMFPLAGHLPGLFPGAYEREETIPRFTSLLDRAREIAADRSIGLALLHMPIPHPPAIYDRSQGRLSASKDTGYVDNVALADCTLGTLEQAIREAGLWDRTAILVSADHGWRPQLWRRNLDWTREDEIASHRDTSGVPFLLRLPGQNSEPSYDKPFDTVVTRELIRSVLEGRLTRPEEIPAAIERDQQASAGYPSAGGR